MRFRFDEQLDLLNKELITMGALCENAIAMSAKALTKRSLHLQRRFRSFLPRSITRNVKLRRCV